ncbi:MAG: bifunctional enoyl-CoA hydratase/phosphate acetyltransferase [Candidatus Cloacimonetes bacterium]|nr:bifunctional enoyl-CoA hydratase/phosphate acetyltransferase [Candidatus Cloacimonadota bacterium]
MLKNFDQLLKKLRNQTEKKTVVIAAAQTESAIEAAVMAKKEGLANSLLVGDKAVIEKILSEHFSDYAKSFEIDDTGSDMAKACSRAVETIHEKKAHIILKGKADTALMLKAVLDKEKGLGTGEVMSDVFAYETPDRLVLMSDGGIVMYPDLKEKISIVKNAVKVAHSLDCQIPKVALLASVEVVNPKMDCTLDAAIICKMNQRNQITGCIIDGPLAFDNAIDLDAAKIKGIDSPVAGKADILIVPNIEAGNIFAKSLTYYAKYRVAHVVMGTKAPILIASRADNAETKMLCMAMGIAASM